VPGTPVPAGGIVTAVTGNTPPASGLSLQNTPNPFNDQTQIEFELPQAGTAAIRIYDAAGRLVKTISQTRGQKGLNYVKWDASNDAGRRVPSGVYFCRLEAFGITRTHKLVVIE
jgi:flagellar hook assembly protein FlgD